MVENERKDDNTGDSGGKSPKKLRVLLRTFGCQMNDHDSELVTGQFVKNGYSIVDKPDNADVILINTCSVRENAENRAFAFAQSLKRLKKSRNLEGPTIGIIGCSAKYFGDKLIERLPHVDLVAGPNDLSYVYDYVKTIQRNRKHIVAVNSEERDRSFYQNLHRKNKNHSYVNISEGCSNFCSYCVVPYVRGAHHSRPAEDILGEVKQLLKEGVVSISLLGQNVNEYKSELRAKSSELRKIDFIDLLDLISDIKGLKEIGFVSSHPKDMDLRLFDLMAKKKNINQYLHLPIQSGSNKILKLMNRKYTRQRFLKIVSEFRKEVPRGVLATDIIVGFPGETEKDFKDTLDLLKKAKFNFAYIFKYSPRPKTKAALMKNSVSEEEKERRHKVILDLVRKISKTNRKSRWINIL